MVAILGLNEEIVDEKKDMFQCGKLHVRVWKIATLGN